MSYVADGKHEGKTEAMLVWAAHPDLEIDKRSKFCVIQVHVYCHTWINLQELSSYSKMGFIIF